MAQNVNEQFINREISWLSFNARVLQEAADESVPLVERLKFLGIFSSNLDEFFRVRFATVKRMVKLNIQPKSYIGDPISLVDDVQRIVADQRKTFAKIYEGIVDQLKAEHIHLVNEKNLTEDQAAEVHRYFTSKVMPILNPIILDKLFEFPQLKDRFIYLAVALSDSPSGRKDRTALVELPTDLISRFLVLAPKGEDNFVILLDDIIRASLDKIFFSFDHAKMEAFTIKITRDAELNMDNDLTESFINKMERSVEQRQEGAPVRMIYDKKIPDSLIDYLQLRMHLTDKDNMVKGGRYHNFKDFIKFPDFGQKHLVNEKLAPIRHPRLKPFTSMFHVLREKDVLLHYPYQSFHHILDLLHEAAIDPKVRSIKMTFYRIADASSVAHALVSAVKNGKRVVVVVELKARFDEASNIYWAKELFNNGVKVIYGVPNLKVHSKLILIRRKEDGKSSYYANISTGNFNENTAKLYADDSLLTARKEITREVAKTFDFFENNLRISRYKHLLVAPFNMRAKLVKMIGAEVANAKAGKNAYIILKTNSVVDLDMMKRLYKASQAGVKIQMIIRGICSIVPGAEGLSENMEIISIVDKYLEHSRVYIFGNDGNEKMYISSADWMTRNLDHRIEVACPIYDEDLREELKEILRIQWHDNVKARRLDQGLNNEYVQRNEKEPLRAQVAIYDYLKAKSDAVIQQEAEQENGVTS